MGKKTTARERVDEAMGKRLKQARESKSLTQKQMAEFLGITPNAYQLYEYGNEISSGRIVQICAILECSPNWLLGVKDTGRQLEPESLLLRELKREFARLNPKGQQKVVDYAKDVSRNPENTIDVQSAEGPMSDGNVSRTA